MKKLLPLAIIAITTTLFPSCKKDYTCTCNYTATGGGSAYLSSFNIHDTKDNAKSNCAGKTAGYANFPGINCDIR
jgi:hypothetical protein